jgi:hypothetical protein
MELEVLGGFYEKYSNIRFNENASSVSRVVPCGQTAGLTDMTKLIVAFRNFAKAPTDMFMGKQGYSLAPVTPYLYWLVTVLKPLTQTSH